MAIRVRTYLLDEAGTLKRVPRRVCEGLVYGTDALPEYAGSRQRVVEAIVENEDGKPARILDAQGYYWTFDAAGQIDHELKLAGWAAMDSLPVPKEMAGTVVDLRPEFKRKQWRSKYRWDITAEIIDRIAADLWPGLAGASEIKAAQGTAPKRPPLTSDARDKLGELHWAVSDIGSAIDDLSEVALKGFAFEARRISQAYSDGRTIWETIAAEADRAREIKARRRTGKGTWYAVLNVWLHVDSREMRAADTKWERCDGKAAAVKAAQRLLADNAHRFSEDVTIEAELFCELEWQPSGADEASEIVAVDAERSAPR